MIHHAIPAFMLLIGAEVTYLDKNHAGILIIWDRLFGTFEPEAPHPTYSLTKKGVSHNPVRIAFHEWTGMVDDG